MQSLLGSVKNYIAYMSEFTPSSSIIQNRVKRKKKKELGKPANSTIAEARSDKCKNGSWRCLKEVRENIS